MNAGHSWNAFEGNEMRVIYWGGENKCTYCSLTCEPERGHSLELRLLQPFPHPAEGFPARLELAPGLRVPEQVRKRPLRAAQHPLGENSLRDAVSFQFRGDPLGHFFGIDLFHLSRAAAVVELRSGRGGVVLLPSGAQHLTVALGVEMGMRVMVEGRWSAPCSPKTRSCAAPRVEPTSRGGVPRIRWCEHLLGGHGGPGVRVGRAAPAGSCECRTVRIQTGAIGSVPCWPRPCGRESRDCSSGPDPYRLSSRWSSRWRSPGSFGAGDGGGGDGDDGGAGICRRRWRWAVRTAAGWRVGVGAAHAHPGGSLARHAHGRVQVRGEPGVLRGRWWW